MLQYIYSILSGAIFVIGVIAGIGPQNLNTMSHAIKRNFPFSVATTCFFADSVLILSGGIGLSLTNSHIIISLINIAGIVFMSIYLLQKIDNLFRRHSKASLNNDMLTKRQAILRALALTWLNPLVFIDTIVVIGGTATQYMGIDRVTFIIGAVLGDFIWLFGLTILAKRFSHHLNRISVWICLDLLTIIILAFILYKTIFFVMA